MAPLAPLALQMNGGRDADLKNRDQEATIFYLSPDEVYKTEKPYFMNVPVTGMEGLKQTNVQFTKRTVVITDMRGNESSFSLDLHGFQIVKHQTAMEYHDFDTPETIVSNYYPEVCDLIKNATGAEFVLPFDYQIRRRDPTLPPGSRGAPGKAQPFGAVHTDQTRRSAMRRLQHFHPEQATYFKSRRIQIVNVWRPLKGPVYDAPLAVCDYRSVQEKEDIVPLDLVFPDYLGETYNFQPNPAHKWYYLNGQQSDESYLVKCFDSANAHDPGIAPFAPHVSFQHNGAPPDAELRESIEVRTYVFHAEDR